MYKYYNNNENYNFYVKELSIIFYLKNKILKNMFRNDINTKYSLLKVYLKSVGQDYNETISGSTFHFYKSWLQF